MYVGRTLQSDFWPQVGLESPTYVTLFNGNQVRQVSVAAVDLQSVPGVCLGGGLECAEIDGEVDRARVGAVEERYELETGGIFLAELRQQVGFDDAGGDDVFD